jgi:hypothetical protein
VTLGSEWRSSPGGGGVDLVARLHRCPSLTVGNQGVEKVAVVGRSLRWDGVSHRQVVLNLEARTFSLKCRRSYIGYPPHAASVERYTEAERLRRSEPEKIHLRLYL